MAATGAKRRGHGEDAIYFAAAKNRYVGVAEPGGDDVHWNPGGRHSAWAGSRDGLRQGC